VDAEDKLESRIATSGQRRTVIIINESELYSPRAIHQHVDNEDKTVNDSFTVDGM